MNDPKTQGNFLPVIVRPLVIILLIFIMFIGSISSVGAKEASGEMITATNQVNTNAGVRLFENNVQIEHIKMEIPSVYTIERMVIFSAPSPSEIECMARNLYFEARNHGMNGMMAVANVTINRMHSSNWPDSACGVIYQKIKNTCQFTWVCQLHSSKQTPSPKHDGDMNALQMARDIAYKALSGQLPDNVKGATHYNTTPVKSWRKKMLVKIGDHLFYE